jgi:hypothetical protein
MKKTSLRLAMPGTAMRIDLMREYMGHAAANELLRRAMNGEPGVFYAQENGLTFGTPDTKVTSVWTWNERDVASRSDPLWMTEALEFAAEKGIVIERKDMADADEAKHVAAQLRLILEEAKHGE